jgi:UDP-glucose 4-epimerase
VERAGDVKHSLAAVEKLRAAGFQAQGNFNDGLNATVAFFKTK